MGDVLDNQPRRPPSPAMSLSEFSPSSRHALSCVDIDVTREEHWKSKYEEMKAILEETRRELDDFQQSSQELENELEAELKRTEGAQEALQRQVQTLEHDCKEWKVSDVQHLIASGYRPPYLQRRYRGALDNATRWENEYARVEKQLNSTSGRIVNLEMENDDLEQKQRAASAAAQYRDEEVEHLLIERDEYKERVAEKAALEEDNHRLKVQLQGMQYVCKSFIGPSSYGDDSVH